MLKTTLALVAFTLSLTLSINANSALLSRLDGQAFYDEDLNITWTADANINRADNWPDQLAWAEGLIIAGTTDWRLASITELSYLYDVENIKASTPGPFSNILGQPNFYWSGTNTLSNQPFYISFSDVGGSNTASIGNNLFAWAVHDGDVAAVPVPAAAWLFGSALIGLAGLKRRK